MTAQSPTGFEHTVMLLYSHNIIVALPLTIVAIKLFVRFVTREPAKDVFRSVLVLPLDLVYVAFGLLLAGIARRIPSFAAHYTTDKEADYAGLVFCIILFTSACLITWLDRGVRILWQKFYAAWNLARQMHENNDEQMVLPNTQSEPVKRVIIVYVWIFMYWTIMIPLVFSQVLISVVSLAAILKRLQ